MAELLPRPIRFLFIYRGYIQVKTQLRLVRFESPVRRVENDQYYDCVDLLNGNVYTVLGGHILNYVLYNMRPLTKSDPEFIPQLPLQQNFHSGYIAPDYNI